MDKIKDQLYTAYKRRTAALRTQAKNEGMEKDIA